MLDFDVAHSVPLLDVDHIIRLAVVLTTLVPCYIIGKLVYNVFFHPLASYPGPRLNAATPIPYALDAIRGRHVLRVKELHDKYGDVVRISPDQLSFASIQARQDIYALRSGHKNLPKDPAFYVMPPQGAHSILTSPNNAHHAKYRRALNHAFSEKAMREQEPLITGYVDGLIRNLQERAHKGPVDMTSWYNFTTFDLIGDLAFGESFDCIKTGKYHPWISHVLGAVRAGSYILAINSMPQIAPALRAITNSFSAFQSRLNHASMTNDKVNRRLATETDRADFMTYILRHEGKDTQLSLPEKQSTMALLVIAGSETTATLLTAATYYLLKNPDVLEKLTAEIRSSFNDESEIDMISVNKLKYQLAVLEETLRVHPPAVIGFSRVVPEGGDTIDGYSLPEGTRVSTPIYTMSRNPKYFTEPESFAPERWLEDPRYANDDLSASKPFSLGPRDCIGKNLAYAEMRLIMARMLWNFNLERSESTMNWTKTLTPWAVWEKGPLMVHLSPVQR